MSDYVPLSSLPVRLVRSCDGCGGTMLLDPSWESRCRESDRHFGGPYIFCRTCQAKEDKREAAVVIQKGSRCTHRLYHDAFSDLVVTAVDGDRVTAVPVGLGGCTEEHKRDVLARCWPAWLLAKEFTFTRSELHMKGL